MINNRQELLRRYLKRIAGNEATERLRGGAGLESAFSVASIEASAIDETTAAVKNFLDGGRASEQELFRIEAIILPEQRPAIDIVNDDFSVSHPHFHHYSSEPVIKKRLADALVSIGRINTTLSSYPYAGTGFVVGQNLIMTNRHVASLFSRGLGVRDLTFSPGVGASVDFKHELGNSTRSSFHVKRIVMIHPYWDMALLEVEWAGTPRPTLALSCSDPEDLGQREVAVIGYPARDPEVPPEVQFKVFRGEFGVKRLQPGYLGPRKHVDDRNDAFPKVLAVTHDSSTQGGNSGSAVIDVSTGEVVALHFAGWYLKENYGVPSSELAADRRIIDAGVKFSCGQPTTDPPWNSYWINADPEDERAPTPNASADLATTVLEPKGCSMKVTIPIEITIHVGQVSMMGHDTDIANLSQVEAPKFAQPFHDQDYESGERLGYDPDFLGIRVPLPEVPEAEDIASFMDDGEHEIPYYNFSVVMHRKRRLAIYTASNVDASYEAKTPEVGKNYSRKGLSGLGENQQEEWFLDPRIPAMHQLPDRFFNKDRKAFDKGHIVRREDVAWGATYSAVRYANGDTYHATNCSPQVKTLNQSQHGKDNWGDLENLVLDAAETERLSVFAGPVFSANDRWFSGVDDAGQTRVKIPSRYWKIIISVEQGEVRSYGFILKQDLSDVAFEMVVPEHWKPNMIRLPELEEEVGIIVLPDIVKAGDQYEGANGEAIRERMS